MDYLLDAKCCHRNREHLQEHTLKADLIVSAVG